ncbi:MAG: DUF1700 domain-containing protein [Acidocella sp.]|nr:DUF1700 domain-containing protein [Acidocella sp.]
MTSRAEFISRLRAALRGVPPAMIQDILADYETHFAEAATHGRTEADVAAKLGDPARLARELRAEAGLRRWEQERSAAAALGAIVAVLGLATFDLFVLLPVLFIIGVILFTILVTAASVMFAGALLMVVALFGSVPGFIGSWLQGVLLGLGLVSGGAATVAAAILFLVGTVNLLARYGRVHIRAASPIVTSGPAKEYAP